MVKDFSSTSSVLSYPARSHNPPREESSEADALRAALELEGLSREGLIAEHKRTKLLLALSHGKRNPFVTDYATALRSLQESLTLTTGELSGITDSLDGREAEVRNRVTTVLLYS